ncbi:hypothetical protein NL676_032789 [Syzygium grande]|nr:hypothetical protein NL676_032789 [Syzygium grande]
MTVRTAAFATDQGRGGIGHTHHQSGPAAINGAAIIGAGSMAMGTLQLIRCLIGKPSAFNSTASLWTERLVTRLLCQSSPSLGSAMQKHSFLNLIKSKRR